MTQRLVVLGAGTALPDRDRDNTSLVWESPAGSVLIDCGGRAYQQLLRADVDPLGVRHVLLTHNHADHIYGLPALVFHLWLAGYNATLDIWANESTLAMAQALIAALDLEAAGHMVPVRWNRLPDTPEHEVIATESYRLVTAPVRHSRPTLAVRITDLATPRTIVYSCDTEPCAELEAFARGADTLIHEATVSDPANRFGHTTPTEAGAIAVRCGVQRLVLIHYSAVYTQPEAEAIAAVRAAGFTGDLHLARELESYG